MQIMIFPLQNSQLNGINRFRQHSAKSFHAKSTK